LSAIDRSIGERFINFVVSSRNESISNLFILPLGNVLHGVVNMYGDDELEEEEEFEE